MPVPDHAFNIEGGCNCGAIRYRVSVPAKSERPIYPGHGEQANPPVQMPLVGTDHCNDCRKATGALLPVWLLTPMDMVTVSLVDTTNLPQDYRLDTSTTERGPWLPGSQTLCAEKPIPNTTLTVFNSSKDRRRNFCSRCGTMFAYQVFPKLDFLPFDMLDIVLGTVDREFLEKEWFMPQRQLWWGVGIEWVQRLSRKGIEGPIHDHWSVAEEVEGVE